MLQKRRKVKTRSTTGNSESLLGDKCPLEMCERKPAAVNIDFLSSRVTKDQVIARSQATSKANETVATLQHGIDRERRVARASQLERMFRCPRRRIGLLTKSGIPRIIMRQMKSVECGALDEDEVEDGGDAYTVFPFCPVCGVDLHTLTPTSRWEPPRCDTHGLFRLLRNTEVKAGVRDRAVKTLPAGLVLHEKSCMPLNLPGVFTLGRLAQGTVFGPYEGVLTRNMALVKEPMYAWILEYSNGHTTYVDGLDTRRSSWLRYVKPPLTRSSSNLGAFTFQGQVYYHAHTPIPAGGELLVDFGYDFYALIPTQVNLKKLAWAREEETALPCLYCDKVFGDAALLRKHTDRQHAVPDSARTLFCDRCHFHTDRTDTLSRHMLTHTGVKPFSCDVCDKSFSQWSTLRSHVRSVHDKGRGYACDVCGKRFGQKQNLTRHARRHTGEKPFLCDKCGRGFSVSSHVRRHVKAVHRKALDVKCGQCEYKCSTKQQLERHCVRRHEARSRHYCGDCERYFDELRELRRHLLTTHSRAK